ncbi:MAG: hypothetical protein IJZ07_00900 [Clostridia bacterium]|nr:hypothetical protein [Clostridia bacterium]
MSNEKYFDETAKQISPEGNQKKKKKRIGCLILIIAFAIIIIAAFILMFSPSSETINTNETSLSEETITEPYTKLDIYKIYQAARKNQVAAELEYKQRADGYEYRYTFVAKVINVPSEQIFVRITSPDSDGDGSLNYYDAYLNVEKEFAATLSAGDWILVENACIEFGQSWHRIGQKYMETPQIIEYSEVEEFLAEYSVE